MKEMKRVLLTGASGFIGAALAKKILQDGQYRVRVLVRNVPSFEEKIGVKESLLNKNLRIIEGSLRNPEDVKEAIGDVDIVFHCAAKKGGYAATMYHDTVVSTMNLLKAIVQYNPGIERIVHISSFAVYKTANLKTNALLTESTDLEENFRKRTDIYSYVKVKQEEVIRKYMNEYDLPVVILRPGVVYGPGGDKISRRVGFHLFGIFMNVGCTNQLPVSYIDNCVDVIMLAGEVIGVEGETFNVLDSDLLDCNKFLDLYCMNVERYKIVKLPYKVFLFLSFLYEKYVRISREQIPPVFNPYSSATVWKSLRFSNKKIVEKLNFVQKVSTAEGLQRHFKYCNETR